MDHTMKKLIIISSWLLMMAIACNNKQQESHTQHNTEVVKAQYTCPMPEDSVFSDQPGSCPKCGMDLVKMETEDHAHHQKDMYTCPMPEDSVFSDQPGSCPKCGMDLVKMETKQANQDVELESLLKPTNEFVVSSIPVTTIEQRGEQISADGGHHDENEIVAQEVRPEYQGEEGEDRQSPSLGKREFGVHAWTETALRISVEATLAVS